ncbi:MAG: CopG family transcriptional regulator [Actinobacteria bacterium]|nr:CopG family transcriptional regulator [Actinomycetota bacterium]
MKRRNVPLSLPADVLRQLRITAATRGTSISRVLGDALRDIVERESGYVRARKRAVAALEDGWQLGTNGRSGWRRDDLHER